MTIFVLYYALHGIYLYPSSLSELSSRLHLQPALVPAPRKSCQYFPLCPPPVLISLNQHLRSSAEIFPYVFHRLCLLQSEWNTAILRYSVEVIWDLLRVCSYSCDSYFLFQTASIIILWYFYKGFIQNLLLWAVSILTWVRSSLADL